MITQLWRKEEKKITVEKNIWIEWKSDHRQWTEIS